jgi:outer membrane biosynthesis protein TonB
LAPVAQNSSFHYSIALHIAAVLIFFIGIPTIFPHTPPQPLVMSVEILPITSVTNVRPSKQPIQEEKIAKSAVNSKPIPKTAIEPPKPPAPVPKPEPAPKESAPVPDETAKPEQKPKEPEKPKDAVKEEPKKPDTKAQDFAALLSKLEQEQPTDKPAKPAKDAVTQEANKTTSDAPYDPTKPLSISQLDAIRSQFIQCWSPPIGAKDAANLAVRVKVKLSQDGTATEVTLARDQLSRYNSDTFFRSAADSALRAVHNPKCSPLKHLPPDNYGAWKELELNFDPKEMGI